MFDQKCYELAEYFADKGTSERDKDAFAQHIQDAVEDWLQDHERSAKAWQQAERRGLID